MSAVWSAGRGAVLRTQNEDYKAESEEGGTGRGRDLAPGCSICHAVLPAERRKHASLSTLPPTQGTQTHTACH